jgi:hypothetical protein
MAVSPDGGLSRGAIVVVEATVVVVAIAGAGAGAGAVSVTASEDDEHAATIRDKRTRDTARFTQ